MDSGSGTMVKGGTMYGSRMRPKSMQQRESGMLCLTMNLFALLNLLPAPHRPQTLVQRLLFLLTGSHDGWPEEVELQDLQDRETGEPRRGTRGRPPTPQRPPPSPPPRSRRRRKNRSPVRRPPEWEEDLQYLGACALTPPLASPAETPEDCWYPSTQESPPVLSPCPGASPPSQGPDSPEHYRHPRPRSPDWDTFQPLPRPTPLPLPDQRPTLQQQKEALEKALRQVSKDAFQLQVDLDADLGRFFGKLGIAPRQ
ncbi:E4 [Canis familiaris papillomavirus 5]|uniref:E4 n=1 Tax=Canis familiaris papillomavirus 5 TaxID=658422 RepID=C8YJK9_9PAPI|nr:E4 [Canis familiaris papillomavirus 5]